MLKSNKYFLFMNHNCAISNYNSDNICIISLHLPMAYLTANADCQTQTTWSLLLKTSKQAYTNCAKFIPHNSAYTQALAVLIFSILATFYTHLSKNLYFLFTVSESSSQGPCPAFFLSNSQQQQWKMGWRIHCAPGRQRLSFPAPGPWWPRRPGYSGRHLKVSVDT